MFDSSYLNFEIIKRYSTGRNTYFSMAGVNFSQVMEKKMNKIFSVLILVTFSFGIISCSSEDPSGTTSQLGQVLDQPNSTDDRNIIDLPVTLGSCYLINNSTIDNSTVDKSSISDNSSIKDSTVDNCSTVTRSIIDNSSTVDYSTISSSTINRSYICAQSTIENSTVDNATVCNSSTVSGGSTVSNGSTVCNSTIDNATIDNATVCHSTILCCGQIIQDVIMSDSVRPTVDNVSSDNQSTSYTVGSKIIIKVAFNETVFVDNSTGNPKLELETGSTDDNATYISGDNSSVLYFIYTVGSGDNSSDMQYKSTSSLVADNATFSANSGTIRDNSSNYAILTLPDNGSSDSLGGNKDIDIDTTGPTALLITCYANTNTPKSSCVDVPPSGHVIVRSSEIGTAYLVKTTLEVPTTGDNLTSITGALDNEWNSVSITSTSDNFTIGLGGLLDTAYTVYAADALGNLSSASTGTGGRSSAPGTMTRKVD